MTSDKTPKAGVPPIPPSAAAKKSARSSLPWSEVNDGGRFATPYELKMARTPPARRVPSGVRADGDEVSSVFMPVEDLYWIKDSLHNLRNEKADRSVLNATIQTFEEKLDMLTMQLETTTHCKKQEEFADLKEAVNSWRTFFRNIVAVGSVGALVAIGGWLWQYYSLVDQVTRTSENVIQVSQNVSTLQEDYSRYKNERFSESVKVSSENDARFVHLEYKLLSAMSQLSQGIKIDAPMAPVTPNPDSAK